MYKQGTTRSSLVPEECNFKVFPYPWGDNRIQSSQPDRRAVASHRHGQSRVKPNLPQALRSAPGGILNSLDVVRRDTLCHSSLLDLGPPVSLILLNQNEPLAHSHAMFRLATCLVIVQRLNILQLLGSTPRCHCRALLLRRRRDRRAAVGVSRGRPARLARVLWYESRRSGWW